MPHMYSSLRGYKVNIFLISSAFYKICLYSSDMKSSSSFSVIYNSLRPSISIFWLAISYCPVTNGCNNYKICFTDSSLGSESIDIYMLRWLACADIWSYNKKRVINEFDITYLHNSEHRVVISLDGDLTSSFCFTQADDQVWIDKAWLIVESDFTLVLVNHWGHIWQYILNPV